MIKNVMEEIEEVKKIITKECDISAYEVEIIFRNSKDIYELIYNSFLLGYMRGIEHRNNRAKIV